jgi:hypothetical protein
MMNIRALQSYTKCPPSSRFTLTFTPTVEKTKLNY